MRHIIHTTIALLMFVFCASTFAGNVEQPTNDQNLFSKNEIAVGYYNHLWDVHIPTPPSPLFWHASQNVRQGGMITYLHLLYHKSTWFSIMAGASSAYWNSGSSNLVTLSALLEFRFWLTLTPSWRVYLLYSVAAPTVMSNRRFAKAFFSSNFLFQDMLGLGMQFGKNHHWHLQAIIVHYSNGDIFPINSGIQVPLMISLGYSF